MAAVTAAQQLNALLPADEQLKLDTIDGETELWDLCDRYAEMAIADKLLADQAAEKARQHKARMERHRQVILQILEAVGLDIPLRRALYTASITHKTKALVIDQTLLSRDFYRLAPDMDAIESALRAGREVPGATLSNPEPTLLLKVK